MRVSSSVSGLTGCALASESRLSLAESIAQLTLLFQLEREILRVEAAWLAGVPYWDAKQKIAEHLLVDAQRAESILKRLHELKASTAERRQAPETERFVLEFASAGSPDEWLHGWYRILKPWLADQYKRYWEQCDEIMDAPSHRLAEPAIEDLQEQAAWFAAFTPRYSAWEQSTVSEWTAYVGTLAGSAGVSEGRLFPTKEGQSFVRPGGRGDFSLVACPRRDRTFKLASSSGDLPLEGDDFASRRFFAFYNHVQEMQFAESLGGILYETSEMPWSFHHDLARHIADEIRHARMGQARLEQLGHPLCELPMKYREYEFRAGLHPAERFCLMTLVMEAGSFERKRSYVKLFEAEGDEVSARYETFDIRDEMLHTHLGHVWVPILLRIYHDSRSLSQLVEHCQRCFDPPVPSTRQPATP